MLRFPLTLESLVKVRGTEQRCVVHLARLNFLIIYLNIDWIGSVVRKWCYAFTVEEQVAWEVRAQINTEEVDAPAERLAVAAPRPRGCRFHVGVHRATAKLTVNTVSCSDDARRGASLLIRRGNWGLQLPLCQQTHSRDSDRWSSRLCLYVDQTFLYIQV